jgi:hypothetical protein
MRESVAQEWRTESAKRKYPFVDSANLTSTEGLTLNDSIFIDAKLYPIGGTTRQYLRKIVRTSTEITIDIYDNEANVLATGTAEISGSSHIIELEDGRGRPAGVLITGNFGLSFFASIPVGTYNFSITQTEFTPSVVVPVPESGVRSISTEDEITHTGDVWLVGKDGVVLRYVDGKIRVDIVGDPLFHRKLCEREEGTFVIKRPLQTINFVEPDRYGNITLYIPDEEAAPSAAQHPAIRIQNSGHRIQLYLAKGTLQ